jgi:hypothetical protein
MRLNKIMSKISENQLKLLNFGVLLMTLAIFTAKKRKKKSKDY